MPEYFTMLKRICDKRFMKMKKNQDIYGACQEKTTLLKTQITDYPEEGLKATAIKKSCIWDLFKMYAQLTCLYVLMVSGSVQTLIYKFLMRKMN